MTRHTMIGECMMAMTIIVEMFTGDVDAVAADDDHTLAEWG